MAAPERSPEDWHWMPGDQLLLKTSFGEVRLSPGPLPRPFPCTRTPFFTLPALSMPPETAP